MVLRGPADSSPTWSADTCVFVLDSRFLFLISRYPVPGGLNPGIVSHSSFLDRLMKEAEQVSLLFPCHRRKLSLYGEYYRDRATGGVGRMKLMLAVVDDADVRSLTEKLVAAGLRATVLASTGGFLRQGNTTLLLGLDDDQIDTALDIIKELSAAQTFDLHCRVSGLGMPIEVEAGGAVVFNANRTVSPFLIEDDIVSCPSSSIGEQSLLTPMSSRGGLSLLSQAGSKMAGAAAAAGSDSGLHPPHGFGHHKTDS